ncbi:hypothetical protein BGZ79_004544, partial [Entomortierella chlamydospora]
QDIPLPQVLGEDETPATSKKSNYTPKKSKIFTVAWEEVVVGNMKIPLPFEQDNFYISLMKLIAFKGLGFGTIDSDVIR